MIVKSLIAAAVLFAGYASAAELSYEVCTYEGPCALRVLDTETQTEIWLVTEDGSRLASIWGGSWYVTSSDDYEKVREMIPESQRWTVRAINPTSGELMESKATPKPATGGPLVTGSVTVNTSISTGGGGCTDCHKGSNAEIHKKKLENK